MTNSLYVVVFYGEVRDGVDKETAKQNLAKLFSYTPKQVEQLFAAPKVIIKSGVDKERARQYEAAMTKAGVNVVIEPLTQNLQAPREQTNVSEGEVKTVPPVTTGPADKVTSETGDIRQLMFEFHGQGGEYFRIWIVNLFLTILTLGIYSAWAKVRNRQYFYGNTHLDDASFVYTASPIAILKGRLIAAGIFGVYSVAGSLSPIFGLVMAVFLMILMPWMITRSLMFNARNSVYRNVSLHFHGSAKEALIPFVLWPIAAMLTFGLLSPLAYHRQQRFLVSRHSYGTARFEFSAEARDYYGMFIVLLLGFFGGLVVASILITMLAPVGMIMIMAVYLFAFAYFSVKTFNLRFNNTLLASHGFVAELELKSYAMLVLTNTLATLVTIGFFRPWAMVRTARYRAEHLSLVADGDLDRFVADEEEQISSLGQEMGDMFDFEFGL